jgi:hypothetical protein
LVAYTETMTFFVQPTDAPKPANIVAFYAGLAAAALLTVVSVAQLFTYEEFPAVLSVVYPVPGGYGGATLFAALLVTIEALAVPYLLRMRLSPLMRLLSQACGVASCLVWLVLGLYLVVQDGSMVSSGLLGATIPVRDGWLPLLFAFSLFVGLITSRPSLLRRIVGLR